MGSNSRKDFIQVYTQFRMKIAARTRERIHLDVSCCRFKFRNE